MPVGSRRFVSIVLRHGEAHAYFVPLAALDAPAEFVTEEHLRREIAIDPGVSHAEEDLALAGFARFRKDQRSGRKAVEEAVTRRTQLAITDGLDSYERAQVERFRRFTLNLTEPEAGSGTIAKRNDVDRAVLGVLDRYFPKPKG